MVAESCLAEIQKAAGRALSDDELDDLLTELQRRQKRAQADSAGDLEGAALKAAEDYANDLKAQATIEKRNAALNVKRTLEGLDFIRSQFNGNKVLGAEALLVGVNSPKRGSRWSAAAQQNELSGYYTGGFMADVEKLDLWREFVSGQFDRDIAKALYARHEATPDFRGIPQEAVKIAEVVHKWQEVARLDANKAGAWIKKLPGYIVRQSHDLHKIRRAGYDEWAAFVRPKLDPKTFAEVDDVDKFLKGVYTGLASGVHLKTSEPPGAFKGPANIGRKMSQERVLHFKDADAWSDYNERFGAGSLREALINGLTRSADSTGLMRTLGPNAEANFKQIGERLIRATDDPAEKQKLSEAFGPRGVLTNRFKELDGSVNIPGNSMAAQVSSNVRQVESMAKLGAALASQFSDIPAYGMEFRYQGRSVISGMGEAIAGLMPGKTSAAQKEILGMLGVALDSMRASVAARLSGRDDMPGRMSRLTQTFFKWNGMRFWTDRLRKSAALGMSHRLALNSGKAWDKLDPDLQRVLGLFGIDDGKWGIIRQGAAKEADGRNYIVPEAVRDLPDDPFNAYLTSKGVKPTEAKVRDLKREIESQLRSYFVDRTDYAVISPDQRTLAMMRRGTQPGTVEGETLRFLGQFKSFSFAFTQKALGRELYGRGANSLGEALKNGNGEMLGLAQLVVWSALFGYGSMTAKDLLKGRTPRDPLSAKTLAAALVQGGGLGIYGDFLLGETNRFGGGLLQTVSGPTFGLIDDVYDLKSRLQNGDDAAAQTLRVVLNNTPFMNLFYTRTALDYLILYSWQESLNPGSLARLERRIQKENGQTFLIRPTQAMGVQ